MNILKMINLESFLKYKLDDYVQSYKNYYIGEKMYFAKYNYSETPHWLKEVIDARWI